MLVVVLVVGNVILLSFPPFTHPVVQINVGPITLISLRYVNESMCVALYDKYAALPALDETRESIEAAEVPEKSPFDGLTIVNVFPAWKTNFFPPAPLESRIRCTVLLES